ncbi:MAG: outer membrane beta-barrel protein [Elusimicrobia bacterium]|nr:outer membrane beta-barrel protein [Elusimicrobiota bacterium]
MKKITLGFITFIALIAFSSSQASALYDLNYKTYLDIGMGYSMPAGGTWGEQYESALSVSMSAEKPIGENYALGIDLGYEEGHPYFNEKNCKPKILYIAPYFKEVKDFGAVDLYASIGLGLYHRWVAAYTASNGAKYAGSFSGKFGGNFGFGALYNLDNGLSINLQLKVHKIQKFVGVNGTMVNARNFVPSLMIKKGF